MFARAYELQLFPDSCHAYYLQVHVACDSGDVCAVPCSACYWLAGSSLALAVPARAQLAPQTPVTPDVFWNTQQAAKAQHVVDQQQMSRRLGERHSAAVTLRFASFLDISGAREVGLEGILLH